MKFIQTLTLMLFVACSGRAQTFSILHYFAGGNSGSPPLTSLVQGPDGRLYGTGSGASVAFAINIDGTGYTNIFTFTGNSEGGRAPIGGLLLSGNTFYGTTADGGTSGDGTIFALATDGSSCTTLYNFVVKYGYNPVATLVLSGSTLYGTTEYGGPNNLGTLFSFNTANNYYTNFYSFTNNLNGQYPYAGLVVSGNRIYGTTYEGGSNNWGTVFAVNTDGSGFTNLYDFSYTDGANPYGGLLLSGNLLYGTTYQGGPGDGNIFAISTNGIGFTNIYNFQGINDGSNPRSTLILSGHTLYGTASGGGSNQIGSGTIFSISTNGTGFTLYHTFSNDGTGDNNDGAVPQAGLLLSGRTLYGAASQGGTNSQGTIFSVTLPPLPAVTANISGSKLVIAWPDTATGYTLMSATSLGSSANWSNVTNTPVIVNGFYTVTNATTSQQMFYYLSQ